MEDSLTKPSEKSTKGSLKWLQDNITPTDTPIRNINPTSAEHHPHKKDSPHHYATRSTSAVSQNDVTYANISLLNVCDKSEDSLTYTEAKNIRATFRNRKTIALPLYPDSLSLPLGASERSTFSGNTTYRVSEMVLDSFNDSIDLEEAKEGVRSRRKRKAEEVLGETFPFREIAEKQNTSSTLNTTEEKNQPLRTDHKYLSSDSILISQKGNLLPLDSPKELLQKNSVSNISELSETADIPLEKNTYKASENELKSKFTRQRKSINFNLDAIIAGMEDDQTSNKRQKSLDSSMNNENNVGSDAKQASELESLQNFQGLPLETESKSQKFSSESPVKSSRTSLSENPVKSLLTSSETPVKSSQKSLRESPQRLSNESPVESSQDSLRSPRKFDQKSQSENIQTSSSGISQTSQKSSLENPLNPSYTSLNENPQKPAVSLNNISELSETTDIPLEESTYETGKNELKSKFTRQRKSINFDLDDIIAGMEDDQTSNKRQKSLDSSMNNENNVGSDAKQASELESLQNFQGLPLETESKSQKFSSESPVKSSWTSLSESPVKSLLTSSETPVKSSQKSLRESPQRLSNESPVESSQNSLRSPRKFDQKSQSENIHTSSSGSTQTSEKSSLENPQKPAVSLNNISELSETTDITLEESTYETGKNELKSKFTRQRKSVNFDLDAIIARMEDDQTSNKSKKSPDSSMNNENNVGSDTKQASELESSQNFQGLPLEMESKSQTFSSESPVKSSQISLSESPVKSLLTSSETPVKSLLTSSETPVKSLLTSSETPVRSSQKSLRESPQRLSSESPVESSQDSLRSPRKFDQKSQSENIQTSSNGSTQTSEKSSLENPQKPAASLNNILELSETTDITLEESTYETGKNELKSKFTRQRKSVNFDLDAIIARMEDDQTSNKSKKSPDSSMNNENNVGSDAKQASELESSQNFQGLSLEMESKSQKFSSESPVKSSQTSLSESPVKSLLTSSETPVKSLLTSSETPVKSLLTSSETPVRSSQKSLRESPQRLSSESPVESSQDSLRSPRKFDQKSQSENIQTSSSGISQTSQKSSLENLLNPSYTSLNENPQKPAVSLNNISELSETTDIPLEESTYETGKNELKSKFTRQRKSINFDLDDDIAGIEDDQTLNKRQKTFDRSMSNENNVGSDAKLASELESSQNFQGLPLETESKSQKFSSESPVKSSQKSLRDSPQKLSSETPVKSPQKSVKTSLKFLQKSSETPLNFSQKSLSEDLPTFPDNSLRESPRRSLRKSLLEAPQKSLRKNSLTSQGSFRESSHTSFQASTSDGLQNSPKKSLRESLQTSLQNSNAFARESSFLGLGTSLKETPKLTLQNTPRGNPKQFSSPKRITRSSEKKPSGKSSMTSPSLNLSKNFAVKSMSVQRNRSLVNKKASAAETINSSHSKNECDKAQPESDVSKKQLTLKEFLEKMSNCNLPPKEKPQYLQSMLHKPSILRKSSPEKVLKLAPKKSKQMASSSKTRQVKNLPLKMNRNVFEHFSQHKVSVQGAKVFHEAMEVFFANLSSDLDVILTAKQDKMLNKTHIYLLMKQFNLISSWKELHSMMQEFLPQDEWQKLVPTLFAHNKIFPQ